MNESKERNGADKRPLRSRFVTLTVESDAGGNPRIAQFHVQPALLDHARRC